MSSMVKRVFYSFCDQVVVDFRANVVRNHLMANLDREEARSLDTSFWETTKNRPNDA